MSTNPPNNAAHEPDKKEAASFEKKAALEAIRNQFRGTASRSQAARLLEALSRFPVNTYEAMRYLDIYYCPARILQLRKRGHPISTHCQTVVTEAGACDRVGLYVLDTEASQHGGQYRGHNFGSSAIVQSSLLL
jgi:Helix-turn-helix domain